MKDIFNENTENFDTDGATESIPPETQRENDDYGDDFDSQTGENNVDYHSHNESRKRKKKTENSEVNKEKLLIFAVAALIVFVAGLLIFFLTYNDGGKVNPSVNVVPTTEVATVAQPQTDEVYDYEEETQYYEPETTEEPTEAETTEYVEPTTEYVEETTQAVTEEVTEPQTEYIEESTYMEEFVVEETTEQIV